MQSVETDVQQVSVSGPLLFDCYLLPLELIFVELNMNYHFMLMIWLSILSTTTMRLKKFFIQIRRSAKMV